MSFSPAEFDPHTGALTKAASAQCCISDITLDEFRDALVIPTRPRRRSDINL